MACLRARNAAPTAIVVVVTQGKPTGTPMIYKGPPVSDQLTEEMTSDSYQKNQRVSKQVITPWSRNIDIMEETANPDS